MNNPENLITKSILDSWLGQVSRVDALVDELSDEQLDKEVAPGRNTGKYLLGHLASVHDLLLPLLGFGEALYPALKKPFVESPDRSGLDTPSTSELRDCWKRVNDSLAAHLRGMQPGEWLHKHTSVSDEDFAKEPHRNRLNVVLSRLNHLSYHYGQMAFLKGK